jgi:hypothetical protein
VTSIQYEVQGSRITPAPMWRLFPARQILVGSLSYDFTPTDQWENECKAHGEPVGIQIRDYADLPAKDTWHLHQVLQERYPSAQILFYTPQSI